MIAQRRQRTIGHFAALVLTAITSHDTCALQAAIQFDDSDLHDLTLIDNRVALSEQEPDARTAALDAIKIKYNVPALAAAVVTSDKIEYLGSVGVRSFGHGTPVTDDDLWHLGSCTKSMTATLAAILVEQGKLKWSTTLADAFPDLAAKMHPDFRPVTLEQLCSNRGGVPAGLERDGLWGKLWQHRGTPAEARRLLLEGVVIHAPDYKPGTKNVYSNGGFAIAGHICETIAGKPYEDLLRELVFQPLNMTSAGFGAPGKPGAPDKPDQPRGHDQRNRPQEPTPDGRGSDNPPAITPAGRVRCTIGDWAKYIQFHLRGSRGIAQTIGSATLNADAFKKLHTPPDSLSDYAFGWSRLQRNWAGPEASRFTLTHNGSNTMWFCVTWIAPANDFAVLVCCNKADGGDKATDEAASTLIQHHLKRSKSPTKPE